MLTLSSPAPNACPLEMSDLELFKDHKLTALRSVITQPNIREFAGFGGEAEEAVVKLEVISPWFHDD